MKKKAAKGKKGGKKGGKKRDVTIVLEDDHMPKPDPALANKNGAAGGPPDRVRWDNRTNRGRTIQFELTWWPFQEAPALIHVDPNDESPWFHIASSAASTGYSYKVLPSLVSGGVPPDDPKVSVGD